MTPCLLSTYFSVDRRHAISLSACAIRRDLAEQKEDYLSIASRKVSTPMRLISVSLAFILGLTCSQLVSCSTVSKQTTQPQKVSPYTPSEKLPSIPVRTLTRMYMSGIRVDLEELERVRVQFEDERSELETRLQQVCVS
jgi:DNA polymerase I-like protein with 3'-5' exonuclease and polymerase domains